jgi:hypothetical protein
MTRWIPILAVVVALLVAGCGGSNGRNAEVSISALKRCLTQGGAVVQWSTGRGRLGEVWGHMPSGAYFEFDRIRGQRNPSVHLEPMGGHRPTAADRRLFAGCAPSS